MNATRKLYKVLATMTANNGKTFEMRIGTGYMLADGQIRIAFDCLAPVGAATRLVEI